MFQRFFTNTIETKFIKSMWSGRRGDPQKLKEVIARLEEERRRDTEERIANDNGSGW